MPSLDFFRTLLGRRPAAGGGGDGAKAPPAAAASRPRSPHASAAIRVVVDLTRLRGGGQNGGVKLATYGLLEAIRALRGGDFRFCTLTHSSLVSEVEATRRDCDWHFCVGEDPDCPLPDLAGRRPGFALGAEAALRFQEQWPADVLYAPLGFSTFCRPGLPWISMIVDTLHRDLPEMLPPDEVAFREQWTRRVIAEADAIQCISAFGRERLVTHFGAPERKLFVTLLALQGRLAGEPRPGTAEGAPYFFYPANDWPHKNHLGLLRAYAIYRRGRPTDAWDLRLSGHFSTPDRLTAEIDRLGLGSCCRLLDYLPEEAFAAAFEGAGALFFPSLYEGFGLPVLEAMSLGVPVACSARASLPEVAGGAALLFDPENPADLARAMGILSSDGGRRAELVRAGRARAAQFTIEREAGVLADALQRVAR